MTRVSLARVPRNSGVAPLPLLDPGGPCVILGGQADMAAPILPAAGTLFGPRGACLASREGPLFVCDTGHHRLLVWSHAPQTGSAPADLLVGQPDFAQEGRNAKTEIGAATLNVPTAVAFGAGVLAVADAWNHRVLLWFGAPGRSNQPADIVLGQADFQTGQANRGLEAPRADSLNWCYGVAIADGRLFVADTGNRRLLVWDRIPQSSGAPADLVLGQRDFTTRDESAGASLDAVGMRWPHGIAATAQGLFVSDAGSNRVMGWGKLPRTNGAPCDFVLGQGGFADGDHNRAGYEPDAASLNMPYGLCTDGARLIVADTANSRLLGFAMTELGMGRAADALAGQSGFDKKGDNRWGRPARDSLCWPYCVASCENALVIADSGNNRVLLWDLA